MSAGRCRLCSVSFAPAGSSFRSSHHSRSCFSLMFTYSGPVRFGLETVVP